MKIEEIRLHVPGSVGQACHLLATLPGGARILAGGTDLLADLKQERLAADHVVSLSGIPGLREIEQTPDGLSLGALVTPNRLAASPEVREMLPALADAASVMGGNQIRNLATLGGNLASAVPSADLPPALLVAGAEVVLVSTTGERRLPLAEFFLGPRETAIRPGEILSAVLVPPPPHGIEGAGSAYEKFQLRDASALAVVGVAAWFVTSDHEIAQVRVAVGASAPTPVLVPDVEGPLVGDYPSTTGFRRAGEIVAAAISPIDDLRGSADYRRRLAAVLTVRALTRACALIPGVEVQAW